MDLPRNRPIVFLSHAKADVAFIQRLDNDLRRCQIDSWLDDVDIRPGEPWLDAIFEAGIPTCDSVLVYLTETSIRSNMVKREIDASIIRRLKDTHVGFLPYVEKAELRDQLRSDIQALQARVWNESNYAEVLPRFVAEVWHKYSDRAIVRATSHEKSLRLEAELELEKQKQVSDGIFSPSEKEDFLFIRQALDREETVVLYFGSPPKGDEQKQPEDATYSVNLLALFCSLGRREDVGILELSVQWMIWEILQRDMPEMFAGRPKSQLPLLRSHILLQEATTFGLVKEVQFSVPSGTSSAGARIDKRRPLSDKAQRFKFWMMVTGNMPQEATLTPIRPFVTVPKVQQRSTKRRVLSVAFGPDQGW